MSVRTHSLALALFCLASAAVNGAGNKDNSVAYRWTDENGVVHYGDRLPPQYATKESTMLNRQGVEVGRTEAQKTPEELAEEARRQQTLLRQKQHDTFLLTTYTSVKDIEALRDERLTQISAQKRAAEQYVDGLNSRITGLETRARNFKPYSENPKARRMPDDLAEDLVRSVNEMRTQRNALAAKDAEENTLRSQFQADIDRYRELRRVVSSR